MGDLDGGKFGGVLGLGLGLGCVRGGRCEGFCGVLVFGKKCCFCLVWCVWGGLGGGVGVCLLLLLVWVGGCVGWGGVGVCLGVCLGGDAAGCVENGFGVKQEGDFGSG